MLNLSVNEWKQIAKSRGIKDYKSMSEDRLLSAIDASEPIRKKLSKTQKIYLERRYIFFLNE